MHAKNGRPIKLEDSIPGYPRGINHLLIHAACDRFLASRGLITDPTSRRHAWLFGAKRRAAK